MANQIVSDREGNLIFDPASCGVQCQTAREVLEAAVRLGKDLASANLGSLQLREAELDHAHLCQADLRVANLAGAHLEGADLQKADLRMAILYEANLAGADLRGANLRCAILERANLTGARLDGADITGTDREEELKSRGLGTGYIFVRKRRGA